VSKVRLTLVIELRRGVRDLNNKPMNFVSVSSAIALIGAIGCIPTKAQEICLPAQELHQARKSMASIDFPGFGVSKKSSLKSISMYEKNDGSKDIFYAGIVDIERKKGWVLRYGGYDANVAWYGPINLTTTSMAGCVPALSSLIQTKLTP
jgi:hypothetical protein